MFDELGAAKTLSRLVLDAVLQPERLGRLVAMASHDRTALTIDETVEVLERATAPRPTDGPRAAALRRVTQRALVDRLLELSAAPRTTSSVRDALELRLDRLRDTARRRQESSTDPTTRAHWRGMVRDIDRWLVDHELVPGTAPLPAPPFDPFGDAP
jgi:hypothetical protein